MSKSYKFSEGERLEIKVARKKNKNVEKRLKALELRAQVPSRGEVATQSGYRPSYISELVTRYRDNGISAITENHYGGNHRNLSFKEEVELLAPFREAAQAGQIVEVSEVLCAYEEK